MRRKATAVACMAVVLADAAAFVLPPCARSGGVPARLAARPCPAASPRPDPFSAVRLGASGAGGRARGIARPGLRMQASGASEDMLPSEVSLAPIPVLERVALAAKRAVSESTGEGTESSGQGRYEVACPCVAGGSRARAYTHTDAHMHACSHTCAYTRNFNSKPLHARTHAARTHARTHTQWGTWCNTDLFDAVKSAINDVALAGSPELWEALWAMVGGEQPASSISLAAGKDWEIKLHLFMSKGPAAEDAPAPFSDIYPTGSLVCLKPLLGITNLRKVRKIGSRLVPLGDVIPLQGGSASGDAFGGSKINDFQLLLGGAIQEMRGTSGPSAVLEIGMLPPMGLPSRFDASLPRLPPPSSPALHTLASSFSSVAETAAEAEEERAPEGGGENAEAGAGVEEERRVVVGGAATQATADLLTSNIGGLGDQLEQIVRRVLVSRADPKAARKLGISHVRGIMLSGPPGCGKTLLARQLARALGAREPMIVNGPEILDKFVGEAEKKIRALFAPAEAEWKSAGDASALHVIVLDEFDSIARKRGSLSGDTTGVRDSVVNQLLAKMDGVDTGDNFLVVALTNRPELLDEALLRPVYCVYMCVCMCIHVCLQVCLHFFLTSDCMRLHVFTCVYRAAWRCT